MADQMYVYDEATKQYKPAAASKYVTRAPDPIFGAYAPEDIAAANKQGTKEATIAAGIGAAGTLAQGIVTAIPTAADVENKKRLADLAKHKGLTQGERADIDEQAMRQVKALAASAERKDEALLAGDTTHSARALQEARLTNRRAVNDAAIEAADIGIRENRAQVQRDVQEEQERILTKDARQREIVNLALQSIGGLAGPLGRVAAAAPSAVAPSKAQFDAMKGAMDEFGRPLYPGVQDMGYDQFRADWVARYKAANAPNGATLPQ